MIFLQFWSVDNVILIILFLLYTETEYIENIVSTCSSSTGTGKLDVQFVEKKD